MLLELDADTVYLLQGGVREEIELRKNRMLDVGFMQVCVLAIRAGGRLRVTLTAYRDGNPIYIAGQLLESHYSTRIEGSELLPIDLVRIAEGWNV